jgi:hypothetical protein
LSKIETFTVVPELRIIVVGSSDNSLRIFKVQLNDQTGMLEANLKGSLKKDSGSKTLEVLYEQRLKILAVVSTDNKLEIFRVNTDKSDSLVKKLLRYEKRQLLKRKK